MAIWKAENIASAAHMAIQDQNERMLIHTIVNLHPHQVTALRNKYFDIYGSDICRDIIQNFNTSFGKLATMLVTPRPLLFAKLFREALMAQKHSIRLIIDIGSAIMSEEAFAIRQAYTATYNRDLLTDIQRMISRTSDLDGSFRYLLTLLLSGQRESAYIQQSQGSLRMDVETIVTAQHRAKKNSNATESRRQLSLFLATRSYPTIAQIALMFNEQEGQSLSDALSSLRSQASAWSDLAVNLVLCSQFVSEDFGVLPVVPFCYHIRNCIKDSKNEQRLLNIIALAAPWYCIIPSLYHQLFNIDIGKEIDTRLTGTTEVLALQAVGVAQELRYREAEKEESRRADLEVQDVTDSELALSP